MKIVYMGSPEFAVPSLDLLHNSEHSVVAVIATPDRRGGRGRNKIIESDVKKYAVDHDIPVLQPTNLKDEEFHEELKSFNADIFAVVAFRMLPKKVWNMPDQGTINLHASLLPAFRGAAPIHRAIMAGETETGLTTFRLQHKIDTGNILLQKKVDIGENETTGQLHDRMKKIGALLMLQTMNAIEENNITPKKQDESLVSHAPKIYHDECQIDFNNSAEKVHNFIRGLDPFPGAWTMIDNKKTKLFGSVKTNGNSGNEGDLSQDNGKLKIKCHQNSILINKVQMQGKRKMSSEDFLNGLHELPSKIG